MTTMTAVENSVERNQKRGGSLLLRRAVQLDALLVFLLGIDMLLFTQPIANFMGLSWTTILTLGVLIFFYDGGRLLWSFRGETIDRRLARLTLYANILWVIGCTAILAFNLIPFSNAGWWAFAVQADLIAVFTIFQWIGLRRASR